jgi:uncharacterized membrane protein
MYSTALVQTFADGHHGGMFMGLHWAWWMIWLAIGAALIWALARMLLEPGPDRQPSGDGPRSPEEALRTRYARGEISDEEFTARSRTLRRSR